MDRRDGGSRWQGSDPQPFGKAVRQPTLLLQVTVLLVGCLLTPTCAAQSSLSTHFAPVVPVASRAPQHENAYATMLYVGTPRDYEFFVATRVMLKVLMNFEPDADIVILCSKDVPRDWLQYLVDDGVRVLVVDDVPNPYQGATQKRFVHTLNKLLVWGLVEYKRVVMLDADNLFIRKTDELFQCGEFCAVFINPCVFHTGLFVLEPKKETLADMMAKLQTLPNRDGADQGFLTAYYPSLLEAPLFRPRKDGSVLKGEYRLPFGYQMDAGFYYLTGKFRVPCSEKSVITFPSAPMMKPWYWWTWPPLPLGLYWHEKRRETIGYSQEMPAVVALASAALVLLLGSLCLRRSSRAMAASLAGTGSPRPLALSALKPFRSVCPPQEDGLCGAEAPPLRALAALLWSPTLLKGAGLGGVFVSFFIPFYAIPLTVHPFLGWALYFEIVMALLVALLAAIPALPVGPVLTFYGCGVAIWCSLAAPIYKHAMQKVIVVWVMAAVTSPLLIWAIQRTCSAASNGARPGAALEREPLMARRAGSGLPADVVLDLVKIS